MRCQALSPCPPTPMHYDNCKHANSPAWSQQYDGAQEAGSCSVEAADGRTFMVRGVNYMKDKVKVPSEQAIYRWVPRCWGCVRCQRRAACMCFCSTAHCFLQPAERRPLLLRLRDSLGKPGLLVAQPLQAAGHWK